MRAFLLVASSWIAAGCATALQPASAASAAATVPENTQLQRSASGEYLYRVLSTGEPRGWERFQLLVDGDGGRTLLMWHNLAARDAQFSVILRTRRDFRPLEAYLNYYVANGHKGSAHIRVDGGSLVLNSDGAAGPQAQRLDVPERLSIGTHPVSADGWHLWQGRGEGDETTANIFIMEASADLSKPLVGSLVAMPYERLGVETLETPAGRFETERYRLGPFSDVWLHGEDRLLVKMVNERRDLEYVLVEYETGP